MFSEISNIFPSLRVFNPPVSDISSGINLASHLGQTAPVLKLLRDYLGILNPFIGRYGGTELKYYLGFFPAFFVFYAIALSRNKFIWTLAIPGIFSLWISLGAKAILSSICFYLLPFFKSIKVMGLFGIAPVYISFVFISAFGFDCILEKLDFLGSLRKFFKHIMRYLWLFIAVGLAVTIGYVHFDRLGLLKSLLVLFYYLPPVICIAALSTILQKFQKIDVSILRTVILIGATLLLIIASAIFSRPFFSERLMFFKINRLIPVLAVFCAVIGYASFSFNKKYSSIIAVFCLGLIFVDLVFFTGLSTYTRLEKRGDIVIPESVKPFEFQKFRMESFWPSDATRNRVYLLRPAMLYLQSSVITKEKFYYQGSLIFSKNREFDFYMLRKFWDAYQRFPERIKRVVMGVDMPKLVFFTDYKVMDDEAVFRECETIDPQLLRQFVYLAPDNYEVPPLNKTSLEQIPSANIEVEHFDNNRLKLSIDAKENGLLYYSDGYDKNWRCYIDGKQQPIRRANVAFKAVFVPQGRHSVLFVYRPIFYLVSFWLFIGACSICSGSAFWCWFKRR